MKKSLFVFIFVLGISFANMCTATTNITFNNISKIYVEYEDGDYQEIALNNTSYTYQVADDPPYSSAGQQTLLVTGELKKNVKISRVALYMASFTAGATTYTIGGYLALDKTQSEFNVYHGVTGIPITNWLSGEIVGDDFTGLNSGVVDFNTRISSADDDRFTYTRNNSFNAVDKSVIIQIQEAYYSIGGISTAN